MGTERFSRAATSDREKQNGLSSKHLTEESQPATAATTAVAAANSGEIFANFDEQRRQNVLDSAIGTKWNNLHEIPQ